ncbi:MAG: hypothetical protein KAQ74_04870 [Dehalococcoidia bacterium]|nr:hypothetical protein [Dehalococcoidia bacterium]
MRRRKVALSRRMALAVSTLAGRPSWRWIALGVFAVIVIVAVRLVMPSPAPSSEGIYAVVIDQLSPAYANEELRGVARESLGAFGLVVKEYEGDEVDVDLYRGLGLMDCGVCLIRSHSGILVLEGEEKEHITSLFTNEPYSQLRHVSEQLSDRVLVVRSNEDDEHLTFGISPLFVEKSMEGELPSTMVIIAGCSCLGSPDLATAFLSRGASVVVSWDRSVNLDYLDVATAYFLEGFFSRGLTLEDAVAQTMAEYGPDSEFGSIMTYLPVAAGRSTARELLG